MEQEQMPNTSFGFNPNSIITANNLKGKLLGLEEKILDLAKEINNENRSVQKNGNTKDEVQDYLKKTSKDVTDKLSGELDNVQEEMNNHFTNQKSENARLQKEIAGLKEEKKQLQDLLMALQRKITDICNFILTYLDNHQASNILNKNLIDIIDNNTKINQNLNNKDKIIVYSMNQVMELFKKENKLIYGEFYEKISFWNDEITKT